MTAIRITLSSPVRNGFQRGSGGPGAGGHRGNDWLMSGGMDFGAPVGTQVFSAFDGVVSWINPHRPDHDTLHVYGAQIFIHDAAHKIGSFYTHLTDVPAAIRRGAPVRRGDLLGVICVSRGMSAHLHFSLAEIFGGARGRFVAVTSLYPMFLQLANTTATRIVEFHQDGAPPTILGS